MAPRDLGTAKQPSRSQIDRAKLEQAVIVAHSSNDFATMSAFWRQALGYVPREPGADGWVVLTSSDGQPPNVSIQRVPEPRRGKNRLHLDLYTDAQEAEVERLLGLGAIRHERTAAPGEDFVVLEDPEGNLFCVIDRTR